MMGPSNNNILIPKRLERNPGYCPGLGAGSKDAGAEGSDSTKAQRRQVRMENDGRWGTCMDESMFSSLSSMQAEVPTIQ